VLTVPLGVVLLGASSMKGIKTMAHAEIKTRILRDLQGDLMDSNHATRRFFRLWLEGSYLGQEHYKSNVAQLKAIVDSGEKGWRKRLHSWTINQFVRFTAHDAQCSIGYAQKVIVEHFKSIDNTVGFLRDYPDYRHFMWLFTEELANDACDLIEDYVKEAEQEWREAA